MNKNIESIARFFREGFRKGNKQLAALVKLADHEFNSQVSLDEATGQWKVEKTVQETAMFKTEEEAINWSTQPVGTRSPEQNAPQTGPENMERTPLMEPVSTDNVPTQEPPLSSTPPTESPSSQEPESSSKEPSSLGRSPIEKPKPKKVEKPDTYQAADTFVPRAFTKNKSVTAHDKEVSELQVISESLRKAGKVLLAEKIEEIKNKRVQLKNENELKATREARIYAQAYIDSLKDNKYAQDNRRKVVANLKNNYNFSERQAVSLLEELGYPDVFIPNYFDED